MIESTDHRCPGSPTCTAMIPRSKLACPNHWYRLPIAYRTAITSTYGREPLKHMHAVSKALAWYKANPR